MTIKSNESGGLSNSAKHVFSRKFVQDAEIGTLSSCTFQSVCANVVSINVSVQSRNLGDAASLRGPTLKFD